MYRGSHLLFLWCTYLVIVFPRVFETFWTFALCFGKLRGSMVIGSCVDMEVKGRSNNLILSCLYLTLQAVGY